MQGSMLDDETGPRNVHASAQQRAYRQVEIPKVVGHDRHQVHKPGDVNHVEHVSMGAWLEHDVTTDASPQAY